MDLSPWNHNSHYYDLVLRYVPSPCRAALDVGCGEGHLVRRLAPVCGRVVGIDVDAGALATAQRVAPPPNVEYLQADFLAHPLPDAGFDLIVAVAALHHLPLRPALLRCRELLAPGGSLVVIGLYRPESVADYAWTAVGQFVSWSFRLWHLRHRYPPVNQRVREPGESLPEIRAAAEELLPGSRLRRELLFRYSLVWRKPESAPSAC